MSALPMTLVVVLNMVAIVHNVLKSSQWPLGSSRNDPSLVARLAISRD